ncbi:MAG: hypothetical protein RLZZ200_2534 [Pseudomonadota bacterium]|jgi:hypothetical protein
MSIQSAHNLRPTQAQPPAARPFGVRVSLNANDPFGKILGPDWQRIHWFATPGERDAALEEMSRRHDYSRPHDAPALVFSKIENRG